MLNVGIVAIALAFQLTARASSPQSALATAADSTVVASGATRVSIVAGGANASIDLDGRGTQAAFQLPVNITLDPSTETLYVLDRLGVRSLTKDGSVRTVVGGLKFPVSLAFSQQDRSLFLIGDLENVIERVDADGKLSKFLYVAPSQEFPPQDLGPMAISPSGAFTIAESRSGYLVTISPSRTVSRVDLTPGLTGVCSGRLGSYVIDAEDGILGLLDAQNHYSIAAKSPLLRYAAYITFDPDDNAFFITDPNHNRILKVSDGRVSIFAGDSDAVDAALGAATFNGPTGIVYDHNRRSLFVTEQYSGTITQIRL